MGSKTISLAEDAYEALKAQKKEGESFSDVVLRLTGRSNLERFKGAISDEFADELLSTAQETRSRLDSELQNRGS